MLDADSIGRRAGELLIGKGQKSELSEQAKAVITAITEAVESEIGALVLVRQASKSRNAVAVTDSGRMKRPTLDEVLLYAAKIMLPEDEARRFANYYDSNGWKVNRVPMKLWTAALANWKRGWQERQDRNGSVSASVETIKNQSALKRVEDRIKTIRGQLPLPANDPTRTELASLKTECARLKQVLGFKA